MYFIVVIMVHGLGAGFFVAALHIFVLASILATFGVTYAAYSRAFWFYLVVSLIGALAALGLTRTVPGLHGCDE